MGTIDYLTGVFRSAGHKVTATSITSQEQEYQTVNLQEEMGGARQLAGAGNRALETTPITKPKSMRLNSDFLLGRANILTGSALVYRWQHSLYRAGWHPLEKPGSRTGAGSQVGRWIWGVGRWCSPISSGFPATSRCSCARGGDGGPLPITLTFAPPAARSNKPTSS